MTESTDSTSQNETALSLETVPPTTNSENGAQDQLTKTQEEEEDLEFEMFSTRKPKDVVAGLSSGLKNFTKGVAAGAVSLVSLPILGAKEGGASGFVKGVGAGVASGVLLPVAGAVTGVVQVGRGVFNTGEAIMESRDGKEWDSERRKWYVYNLTEEAESVMNETEEEYIARIKSKSKDKENAKETKASPKRPSVKVKELDYYKALEVEPNATPGEIKKAYYLLAKRLHPDKNQDDPNANEKFQKVGEAYQVLIDAELREKYDKFGKDGVEDAPTVDPSAFYAMVFGSDKFEPLVGELKLAMMMAAGADGMDGEEQEDQDAYSQNLSQAQLLLEYKQKRREVQIALNLAERLTTFVEECNSAPDDSASGEASAPQFKAAITAEATELSQTAFGGTLLDVIGYVYIEQSLKQLGFKHSMAAGLGLGEVKRKGHVLANNYRVARSALKAYQMSKKLGEGAEESAKTATEDGAAKEEEEPTENAGEQDELEMAEKQMPFFMEMLETLWNMSIIDIESTLRKACRKVLRDSGVSPTVRIARARGMLMIGEVFQSYGQTAEVGLGEFKQKMKDEMEASRRVAQEMKKQQQAQVQAEEEARIMEMLLHKPFTGEELSTMSVAQLKKVMELRSMSTENCLEKSDLISAFLTQQEIRAQQG